MASTAGGDDVDAGSVPDPIADVTGTPEHRAAYCALVDTLATEGGKKSHVSLRTRVNSGVVSDIYDAMDDYGLVEKEGERRAATYTVSDEAVRIRDRIAADHPRWTAGLQPFWEAAYETGIAEELLDTVTSPEREQAFTALVAGIDHGDASISAIADGIELSYPSTNNLRKELEEVGEGGLIRSEGQARNTRYQLPARYRSALREVAAAHAREMEPFDITHLEAEEISQAEADALVADIFGLDEMDDVLEGFDEAATAFGDVLDDAVVDALAGHPSLEAETKHTVLAYVAANDGAEMDEMYAALPFSNRGIGQGIRFLAEDGYVVRNGDSVTPTVSGHQLYAEAVGTRENAAAYRHRIAEALRGRFPDGADATTATTIAAVLMNGGNVRDAEPHIDVSYQTALRRRDALLRDAGLVVKEGEGVKTSYTLEPGFADEVQRYLEVFEPAPALEIGARTAHQVDDLTGLRTRTALNMPIRNAVPDAELPEPFDIWPQLEEFLAFARAAEDGGSLSAAGDYLGHARNVVKDRLATLEKKGLMKADIKESGTDFVFDPSTRPVIETYAEAYDLDMGEIRFTDVTDAWIADLFADREMYEDLHAMVQAAITKGGISTYRRKQDLDRDEADVRYERLAEAGYVTRPSSSRGFIFDSSLRPLLRAVADTFDLPGDEEYGPDDPLDSVQFRNIAQFEANRERMQQDQNAAAPDEDAQPDAGFSIYDGDPGDGEAVANGGADHPAPDVVLDSITFHRITDRDVDDLLADIDAAVPGADDVVADVNTALGGDAYLAEPRSRTSSQVVLPVKDGGKAFTMDGERYRAVEPHTGNLSDGLLLFTPGDEVESLTGFRSVAEVLGGVRER